MDNERLEANMIEDDELSKVNGGSTLSDILARNRAGIPGGRLGSDLEVPDKVVMNSLTTISVPCPKCGAMVSWSDDIGKAYCQVCKSLYSSKNELTKRG